MKKNYKCSFSSNKFVIERKCDENVMRIRRKC